MRNIGHVAHSKKVSALAKALTGKCAAFATAMADSVCGHKSQPAREEARKRAATLFGEIQVRSNSLHSDDLFVDEAKKGGDND